MIAQAVALGTAVDYVTGARHGRRSRAHEHALTGYALDGLAERRRACASSARPTPSTAAPRSRSRSTACTRTTSRSCSTSTASRCAPATTAPVRSACATEYRRPPERRSVCTRRPTRSTRWSRASRRCRRCSRMSDADWSRCTRRSSSTTTSTRSTAACSSRSTPRCTTSTRPAATRSRCGCASRDGTIADLGWDGEGCSISQASTSVMSDLVIGKPVDEALALQRSS